MPGKKQYCWLIAACLVCLSLTTHSKTHIVNGDSIDLSDKFEYLIDPEGTLDIHSIQQPHNQLLFKSTRDSKPKTEHRFQSVWLKLELRFKPVESQKRYVIYPLNSNILDMKVYRPTGKTDNETSHYSEYITGNNYPNKQREIQSSRYGFLVTPSKTSQVIYIRIQGSTNAHLLSWALADEHTFNAKSDLYWVLTLVTIGVLIGILLFNVGIGLTLKHKSYLIYSVYVMAATLSLSNLDGSGYILFWANWPEFNQYSTLFFSILISLTRFIAVLFFFDIAKISPALNRVSWIWVAILCLLLPTAFTPQLYVGKETIAGIVWLLSALFGILIALYAIKKNVQYAKAVFVILLIPIVGSLYQGLVWVGTVPSTSINLHSAKIAFVIHALLFSICIALQIKFETTARIKAQHDELTGLPTLFIAQERFRFAAALAERYQWRLAVLFIDLDEFKPVNDNHGHEMGNKLLVAVSQRIKSCLREVDTLARIGGDEFIVIQTEVKSEDSVIKVAEKIQRCFEKSFHIDGETVKVTASIGIAQYPNNSNDLNSLMKFADQAMYQAKRGGKNAYHVYNPAVDDLEQQPGPAKA